MPGTVPATSVVVDAVTLTPVGAAGPTGTELRQAVLAGQRVIATYEAVG